MTNNPAPVEQRHLINVILAAYHTTRLNGDPATHILSKPSVQEAFARFERAHCIRADALREAWRDGWDGAKACLTDDEAAMLTADVEHDIWLDSKTATTPDAPQVAPDVVGRVKVAIKKALHGIWPIDPDDVDDCANIAAQAAIAAMEDQP